MACHDVQHLVGIILYKFARVHRLGPSVVFVLLFSLSFCVSLSVPLFSMALECNCFGNVLNPSSGILFDWSRHVQVPSFFCLEYFVEGVE